MADGCRLLFAVLPVAVRCYRSLLAVCCLFAVRCLLIGACNMLSVVCLLFDVVVCRRVLFVGDCCVLYVACWLRVGVC